MTARISKMSTQRLATASCAIGLLTYAGLTSLISSPEANASGEDGPPVELTGVVRGFRDSSEPGKPVLIGGGKSEPLTLTLVLDGAYVFDDKLDPEHDVLGGN